MRLGTVAPPSGARRKSASSSPARASASLTTGGSLPWPRYSRVATLWVLELPGGSAI